MTQQRNWMEMCVRGLCGNLTIGCLQWGGQPSRQKVAAISHHLLKLAVRKPDQALVLWLCLSSSKLFLWAFFQMKTWHESKGFARCSIWPAKLPSLVSFPLPWCLLKIQRLWCLLASNSRTFSIMNFSPTHHTPNYSPLKPLPSLVWILSLTAYTPPFRLELFRTTTC